MGRGRSFIGLVKHLFALVFMFWVIEDHLFAEHDKRLPRAGLLSQCPYSLEATAATAATSMFTLLISSRIILVYKHSAISLIPILFVYFNF